VPALNSGETHHFWTDRSIGNIILDDFKEIRDEFSRLSKLPDESIDLVRAALLIARTSYPHLDEASYHQYLNGLANRLKSSLNRADQPTEIIAKLNRILFDEEGFRGNRHHYFDPDNNFLNRVIDRKLGIPITLSLVYIEVGRLAGLNLHGIALPGHFIAAHYSKSERILLDPFNEAKIISEEECHTFAGNRLGEKDDFNIHNLSPAKPKEILVRILRNLKAIYFHSSNDIKTFEMLHWILTLKPDTIKERLERGLRYEAMGNNDRAIKDFQRYLELSPEMENASEIYSKIERLKQQTTWIH
jgi:regulator of sirC expression with transglutaminase-like and TPR domain